MLWRGLSGACLAAALVLAGAGCSGGGLAKVKGVVTLDGEPLAGAMVSLVPEDGHGQPGQGYTKGDGSFEVETLNEVGAVPGEYRILVTKRVLLPGAEDRLRAASPGKGGREGVMAGLLTNPETSKSVVPEVYTQAPTTPLRCTVPLREKFVLKLQSSGTS